jgi:hypothetical protein
MAFRPTEWWAFNQRLWQKGRNLFNTLVGIAAIISAVATIVPPGRVSWILSSLGCKSLCCDYPA